MSPTRRDGPPAGAALSSSATPPSLSLSYAPSGLEAAIDNAHLDWWATGAQLALVQLAKAGRGFTVDDLLDLVGQPPAPQYVGAVLAAAQRLRLIEPVGCQIGRDGRMVRRWFRGPNART